MAFTVETSAGDEVAWAETLAEATERARNALEGDPEMGSLDVYEFSGDGLTGVLRKTVTFGPDADWQSVVVVLEPGEKVQPPTGSIDSREIDGWYLGHDADPYDPADPKSAGYHDRMSAIYDNREKV